MSIETIINEDLLTQIKQKETRQKELETELSRIQYEIQELKRVNTANVVIPWKEAIKNCLEIDANNSLYFLKTPAFVAKCIGKKYGIDVARDAKNKISTTLSIMFNQGLIGRVQHGGKSFYGLTDFFKKDLVELKTEYDKIKDNLLTFQ